MEAYCRAMPFAQAVSVRRSAVGGGANLARTLRSADGRGGRFGGGGGLTRGLPRGREHCEHVAQAEAARESRQDVGQVLDRVHVGQPAAAQIVSAIAARSPPVSDPAKR